VAFRINEYRKLNGKYGAQIGYVVRDMRSSFEKLKYKRPELILPPDLCVVAGTKMKKSFKDF